MDYVYTLKIRYSGDEDDVFVFSTKEKAEAQIFKYFQMETSNKTLSQLTDFLFREDIGYYDINLNRIL